MNDIQKYPIYFEPETNRMYYIEWYDTGNNEIPTKHYINIESPDRTIGISGSISKKCPISTSRK